MNGEKILPIYFVLPALMSSFNVSACPFCHTSRGVLVRAGLFHHHFLLTLGAIIAIFLLFTGMIILISYLLAPKIQYQFLAQSSVTCQDSYLVKTLRYFLVAGMLLGGGSAGFIDGILFHQILQWHSMLANKIPLDSLVNIEINMFWDGLFHALTLLITLTSFGLFWISVKRLEIRPSTSLLMGAIFIGSGLFNVIEGIIDHQLLQLHHVRQVGTTNGTLEADLLFLFAAAIAMGLGVFCIRKSIPKAYGLTAR